MRGDLPLTQETIAVRACVFDAYGTLFDFASAAAGCADVLGDKAVRYPVMGRWPGYRRSG